jgi:NADH dehydrogenase/NADH:ubiquinone oxidoreductase subunit G
MIRFQADNQQIEAEEGTSLLQACLDNGIYIPNLCYLDGMDRPPASCRLCFVEISGVEGPLTACTVQIADGMTVWTQTPAVRRLQRSALRLLLSVHHVDCARCPANKQCELQRMAKFLKIGLKSSRIDKVLKTVDTDEENPFLDYHPNRCVLCGKCIHVCRSRHGKPFLTFAKRGIHTIISFYGEKQLSQLPCRDSIACVEICPVGAITLKSDGSHTPSADPAI